MDALALPPFVSALSNSMENADSVYAPAPVYGGLDHKTAEAQLSLERQSSVLASGHVPIFPTSFGYSVAANPAYPFANHENMVPKFTTLDPKAMHIPHNTLATMALAPQASNYNAGATAATSDLDRTLATTIEDPVPPPAPVPSASFGLVMFCMFACLMMVAVPASEYALASTMGVSSVTATLVDTTFGSSFPFSDRNQATTAGGSSGGVGSGRVGRVLLSLDPSDPSHTWSYQTDSALHVNIMPLNPPKRSNLADPAALVNEITSGKKEDLTTDDLLFEVFKRLLWTQLESTLARCLRALQLGSALSFALLNTLFGQVCFALPLLALIYTAIKWCLQRGRTIATYVLQAPQVATGVPRKAPVSTLRR